jgi:hypothetical protein
MLARRIFYSAAILLAASCAPTVYAEAVGRIDARKQPSDHVQYHVVLCARESGSGGSGHAFVVWIEHDQRSGRTQSAGYGFYPGYDRVVTRLFMGKGRIVDETTKAASTDPALLTHRLIVSVDRETFLASKEVKEKWEQSEYNFNLLGHNCNHFAYDVARDIGLAAPTPNRAERPPQFIGRLMDSLRPPAASSLP